MGTIERFKQVCDMIRFVFEYTTMALAQRTN